MYKKQIALTYMRIQFQDIFNLNFLVLGSRKKHLEQYYSEDTQCITEVISEKRKEGGDKVKW